MRSLVSLLVAVLLVTAASAALGAEWWEEEQTTLVQRQKTADSEVITNWEQGYVEAVGMGTADMRTAVNAAQAMEMAVDAARVRAYAALAETVLGFNITSQITVRNGLTEQSEQRIKLDGFLRGARVIGQPKLEWADNAPVATVKVGILIAQPHPGKDAPRPQAPKPEDKPKTLMQAVMPAVPQVERQVREEHPVPPYQPPAELPPPPPTAPAREVKNYTSLILDARGFGGSPSISPRILTADGAEVWGTMQVDPDYAINYGIAGWARDLDTAKGSTRAGPDPLIIRAIGARGLTPEDKIKTYFVVSDEDAAFIKAMNERTKFLDSCNVIIIP